MATQRHSNDDEFQPPQAGGTVAQGVVDLLSATLTGLVFWSRQPFEVAAELQLRVHSKTLPGGSAKPEDGWLTKSGFVVQCKPARRADGSVGFHVSVLYVPEVTKIVRRYHPPYLPQVGKSVSARLIRPN